MVAIIPPEYVAKPTENFPLRYGIFQASIGPLNLPVHARIGGLRYETAVCGEGYGYEVECIDDLNVKTALGIENGTTDVLGAPFIVYATLQCGGAGTTNDEQRAFAIERLRSVEQSVVEDLFSTGAFGQAPTLGVAIQSLTGGGTTAVEVLSELERARYCGNVGGIMNQYGPRAVLHVPIAVLNELKSQHVVEWSADGKWRTPMGTAVSAGCYANQDTDGNAPADGTFWMYITGQTVIWRTSDEDLLIPPVEGVLDRATNQYKFLVEREYVVTYECGGFAKAATLWTP